MSECIRGGVRYKRHRFSGNPTCKFCYLPKRNNARTGRASFIRHKALQLMVKAEPPMSMAMAKFHARGLWDRKLSGENAI